MLVFPKEDAQRESFVQACERGSYKYTVCKNAEAAMELFQSNHPEVSPVNISYHVIISMINLADVIIFPSYINISIHYLYH